MTQTRFIILCSIIALAVIAMGLVQTYANIHC